MRTNACLPCLPTTRTALGAGMDRLLANAFEDCVVQPNLVICPYESKDESTLKRLRQAKRRRPMKTPQTASPADGDDAAATPESIPEGHANTVIR